MKLCQLQQEFQENWEEENEALKKYVDEQMKSVAVRERKPSTGENAYAKMKESVKEMESTQ